MNKAKAELLQAFEGTDNGNLTSFCGVEIKTNERGTSLCMEYYWDRLMKKFNVRENEIERSPLKTKIKRSECPIEPDEKLKTSYLQIIGSIIYGYTHCRLDLAFPVNMLTRIMHSPSEQHYHLLKTLLHYINGTKNWTLNFFRDQSVYYGMDLSSFAMWMHHMLTMTNLTVLLVVGFSSFARDKELLPQSQDKPKIFLSLQPNPRQSGEAMQLCKERS